MKKMFFIMAAVLIPFIFTGCGLFGEKEGSPESVINAYVSAASENDIEAMEGFFAADEVVSGYDIEKMAERLQISVDQVEEYVGEVSPDSRDEDISTDIMLFDIGFLGEDVLLTIPSPEALQETLDAFDKSSLTVKRTDPISFVSYDVADMEETANEQLEWIRVIYGAEDCDEYTALLEYDGDTYFFSAQFLKYDGEWKIFSTSSTLSKSLQNFSAYSVTVPMTESEYSEMAGS